MTNLSPDNDLIERYLLGKLTDAEVRSFKIRLGDDREFARKYRLISTFPEMMSEPGRLEYEQNLAKAAAPVVKKKSVRLPKPGKIVWAAGGLIILAGIAFLFLVGPGHKDDIVVQKDQVNQKTNVVAGNTTPAAINRGLSGDSTLAAPGLKPDSSAQQKAKAQPESPVEQKNTLNAPDRSSQKAFELLNPADGMKFSVNETIVFHWKQKTDTFTRFYIVSEPTGQVVFWRGIRLGVREFKVPGSYLYPGKYYWYVGRKDEKRTFSIQ